MTMVRTSLISCTHNLLVSRGCLVKGASLWKVTICKIDRRIQTHLKPPFNPNVHKGVLPSSWSFKVFSEGLSDKDNNSSSDTNVANWPSSKNCKWSSYPLPKETKGDRQSTQVSHLESSKSSENMAEPVSETSAILDTSRVEDTNPTVAAKKKRAKRKLRPRKALITLSPRALVHLKALLDQPVPKLIKISVRNRGCSGLTYDLQYVSEPGKFDEVVEQDGVKIIVDSKALFSIVGSEMDWVDDTLSARFVFKNPNSKGTCGCGESFMV